jgi:hypothetical protein
MDQETLVTGGRALIKALDDSGIRSQFAMWVHNSDTDTWKLWIVPPKELTDKREFYRRVAEVISKDRNSYFGIDIGDTEMKSDAHPVVKNIRLLFGPPGAAIVTFRGRSTMNGFVMPEGICLRAYA